MATYFNINYEFSPEAVAALKGWEPANLEEQALCLVGKDIFHKLIKDFDMAPIIEQVLDLDII